MGRRGSCVRSSLSSLSSLLPPEKYPARISPILPRKSNVKRSVRRIERVPGKSAFPGFFVSDKTMAAIDERWKGSGHRFQAGSKIEAERLRVGGWSACASYLRAEGEKRKGARVRAHLPRILREQFPSPLFKAVPHEFVARINHGSYPGIDPLCRLHLNKGWNETKVARFCRVFLFSSSFFQIIIFVNDKINNIICLEIVFKNYIFKRGNVSIKTRVWVLTLSIIERYRKGYSLEMWCIYIYARTETRKRLRHIRNKRRRILI